MGKKAWLIILSAFSIFLFLPSIAEAAGLNFSPLSASYATGATFSTGVYVSTSDQAMNGVSGVISFPADKLEVVSLSKSGSIISLWVVEPNFSNTAGTINFEGIVLNPGFSGKSGKIITVQFRAKKLPGNAEVKFTSGAVLANDGKGTNILTSLGKSEIYIGSDAGVSNPVPTTPSLIPGTPAAPAISSQTHSDPAKWYTRSTAKFVWEVPADVDSVRLSANKIPTALPNVLYSPAISSKELFNLDNGTWYLHAQFRNSSGWGEIAHFRFRVDHEKPESFEILEVLRKDATEPRPEFIFKANDKISGVQSFLVQIDNHPPETWKDDGSHLFKTPNASAGNHILVAKAIDGAGNFLTNSVEFVIKPLNTPKITEWQDKLQRGEELVINGKTDYPGANVIITIEDKKGEAVTNKVKAGERGEFEFISAEELLNGVYKIRVLVEDERGAKSLPTEDLSLVVRMPRLIQISTSAITILAIIVPLVALILILAYLLFIGWHKFTAFKKKIRREVHVTEKVLHKTFTMLKESVKEQIKAVENAKDLRKLTKEEDNILKKLKKDLQEAESFVEMEIEKIEKTK